MSEATPHSHLLGAAQEGARIRAVASLFQEVSAARTAPRADGEFGTLDSDFHGIGDQSQAFYARFVGNVPEVPRSFVVVARSQTAELAARAALAAVANVPCPIHFSDHLPRFVGALDCVAVLTPDPLDHVAALAVEQCRRTGAATIVVAPSGGPVAETAESFALVAPDIPNAVGESFGRYCIAVAGLAGLAGLIPVSGFLEEAADCVDREMTLNAPGNDLATSPARGLGSKMRDHRLVFSGDETAWPLAQYGAAVLAELGIVAASLPTAHVAQSWRILERGGSQSQHDKAAVDPVFYDPFLDGPAVLPLAVLVIAPPRPVFLEPYGKEGAAGGSFAGGSDAERGGFDGGLAAERGGADREPLVSPEVLDRLESYFEGGPAIIFDFRSAHTRSSLSYSCVAAARFRAAAAYCVDENLSLED